MDFELITGFEELDKYLSKDEIIEFYSEKQDALDIIYHRILAIIAPANLIIVGARGGFNPLIFKRFCRIFNKINPELYIQRAFKAEDIEPSIIDKKSDLPLVIYNPYTYRKLYANIIKAIRNSRNRVLIFSLMDRKRKGSTLGAHIAHSMIELRKDMRGFQARIVKSVLVAPITIKLSREMVYHNATTSTLLDWV